MKTKIINRECLTKIRCCHNCIYYSESVNSCRRLAKHGLNTEAEDCCKYFKPDYGCKCFSENKMIKIFGKGKTRNEELISYPKNYF